MLDNLRNRSATLLAAASIATSFLGGAALSGDNLTLVGWVAVSLFVLSNFAVLYILWPRGGWTFRLGADELLKRYITSDKRWTLTEVQEDLAGWWEVYYGANERKLARLFRAYQTGAVLLMLVVVLFLVELVIQGGITVV